MNVILSVEERARRKAIWDKMTEEERREAEDKREEISRWYAEQEKAVYEKLKQDGKLQGGLDGYYPEVVKLNEEYKQRLKSLLESLFAIKS